MEQLMRSYQDELLALSEGSVLPMVSLLFDSRIPGESEVEAALEVRTPSFLAMLQEIQRELQNLRSTVL